jgi:hypothetical protein
MKILTFPGPVQIFHTPVGFKKIFLMLDGYFFTKGGWLYTYFEAAQQSFEITLKNGTLTPTFWASGPPKHPYNPDSISTFPETGAAGTLRSCHSMRFLHMQQTAQT